MHKFLDFYGILTDLTANKLYEILGRDGLRDTIVQLHASGHDLTWEYVWLNQDGLIRYGWDDLTPNGHGCREETAQWLGIELPHGSYDYIMPESDSSGDDILKELREAGLL